MFEKIKNIFKKKENGGTQPFSSYDIFINEIVVPQTYNNVDYNKYCVSFDNSVILQNYNKIYNNSINFYLLKFINKSNTLDFYYYTYNKNKIFTKIIPIKKDFNDCFYVQFLLLVKGSVNNVPYSVYRVLFCNEIESVKVDILDNDLLELLKKYTNEDCLNQVKKGSLSFGADISPVKYQKLKKFLTTSGINYVNYR